MNAVVRSVIGFVFGVAFTCVVSWLAGYNFDTRGGEAVVTFIFSVMLGAAVVAIVYLWSMKP